MNNYIFLVLKSSHAKYVKLFLRSLIEEKHCPYLLGDMRGGGEGNGRGYNEISD